MATEVVTVGISGWSLGAYGFTVDEAATLWMLRHARHPVSELVDNTQSTAGGVRCMLASHVMRSRLVESSSTRVEIEVCHCAALQSRFAMLLPSHLPVY